MSDLLPLETGMAPRSVRDAGLRARLLSLPARSGPVDEVDLVLLASATAVLQEDSDSQAAYRAAEAFTRHPDRLGLADLAKDPAAGDDVLRPLVEEYLTYAGYGRSPVAAFQAICDIYLGRVYRQVTHPMLGVGCVAYFSAAGLAEPQIEATTGVCHRWWVDWKARDRSVEEIEEQAAAFAASWVRGRSGVTLLRGNGGAP